MARGCGLQRPPLLLPLPYPVYYPTPFTPYPILVLNLGTYRINMDGLSAAVNVGSAIDLSVKGLAYLAKYYSDVKTAEASLHEFKECLHQELQALKQLKTLYERLKGQEDLTPHSVECLHSLEHLFQEDSNHPESQVLLQGASRVGGVVEQAVFEEETILRLGTH
ncbi:hypothetical protein QCA50_005095 [Cerrena zonata]|uniref:Uncharacterized protein n=1 Tax=Cerrena zonata TaxID=2478898 RepID=A0AAW0GEI3_9APHY